MDWREVNNTLSKSFKTNDFSTLIERLVVVAKIADELEHYPNFHVYNYNEIRFELTTHDENGITELDYKLAYKLDQIFE